MKIGTHGEIEEVSFWPADEIAAAFKRVNAALDKPDELKEMRLFVQTMNYFYKRANICETETSAGMIEEVCRLANKALCLELGIEPEGNQA